MDVHRHNADAPTSSSPARSLSALAVGGVVFACFFASIPTLRVLLGGPSESMRLDWDAAHAPFVIGLDPLSAYFLLPILGLSALAAVYGSAYMQGQPNKKSLGPHWFFFGLFVASMALAVIARTAILFLISWEMMSLAAYFLVTFEDEKPEVRRSGWIYLIATHLGIVFLIAAFALLGKQAGSLEFAAFQTMPRPDPGWSALIFVLALIGFGIKAGFVPFHVWLPEAHPAAPSHVSALMSGVMIKMGLYGLLRLMSFLGPPVPWWGLTLAGIGLGTALVGISLALCQRDIKRVLAYSSIENIGLISMALGVGFWGWASNMPLVASLAFTGALLHIWNHALMKGLMFLAAGSVLHGSGTKDMERLGGLLKHMPWTGNAMLLGSVAIAALPPLNGFVSKWLMYLSLMNCGIDLPGGSGLVPLLSVGLLALIGGLSAITFVRLAGIVLLGSSRSEAAEHAHEASGWMIGPMTILALLCVLAAVFPFLVVESLAGVLDQLVGRDTALEMASTLAALRSLGACNGWIGGTLLLAGLAWLIVARNSCPPTGPTWGCGYLQPTPRMQYTGWSFADTLAEHLLPRLFRPRTTAEAPTGLFPAAGEFSAQSPDPFSEKAYEPFFARWAERFAQWRILQQGKIHVYLVYIFVTVVVALAWASLRTWWGTS